MKKGFLISENNRSIHLVSVSTITYVPIVKYLIESVYLKKYKKIEIIERSIKNANNYYLNNNQIELKCFQMYENHEEFNKEPFFKKIRKYFYLTGQLVKVRLKGKNSTLYTIDHHVLFIFILVSWIIPWKKNEVIYHQLEMVDKKQLGKINNFIFNVVLKNVKIISHAIFPEINRMKYFIDISGIDQNKTVLIPNTCKSKELAKIRHEILHHIPENAFVIGHIGNIGINHYLKEFIDLAKTKKFPENFYFLFVGRQAKEIKDLVNNLGKQFIFIDAIPHQDLEMIYSFIDLGLILYKGVDSNFEFCAPNKLYEYWSYGVPVIAHELDGLKPVFVNPLQGKLINMSIPQDIYDTLIVFSKQDKTVRSRLIDFFNLELQIDKYSSSYLLKLKNYL
jgi:hypothetical protein